MVCGKCFSTMFNVEASKTIWTHTSGIAIFSIQHRHTQICKHNLTGQCVSKQIAMWNNIFSELILILSTYYWQSAAAVLGKDLEKPKSDVTPVHRIRITLTSTNVRSLEKVCADLISRAKKLSLPVKVSFYFAALSLLWWFSNESTNAQTNL